MYGFGFGLSVGNCVSWFLSRSKQDECKQMAAVQCPVQDMLVSDTHSVRKDSAIH